MDKFIAAGGAIEAIFFQQVGDDPAQTAQAREAQIASVADTVATFIHGAAPTLDLAIYDFRLADAAADRVKVALQDRAAHGVAIRILYDITAAGGEGDEPGNDMAPAGTAVFSDPSTVLARLRVLPAFNLGAYANAPSCTISISRVMRIPLKPPR